METRNSIFFLLLLFLANTQAAIAMQENLNLIATEVADKVEESKERCCEYCHHLVEVICEAREDWWNALLAWLRSLGGSQGICDILQRLLDFTNSLIHLVDCNLSYKPDPECSKTSLANQLAWLKEHDVANTDQLSFTSKAALTIVVIFIHLALSALILAFILPFVCNCVGCFNTKVEKVLARTTRTISTRRTRSRRTRRTRSRRRRTTSRRSSRKATPAGRTHSTIKDKLTIFSGAQAAGSGNLDLGEGKRKVKVEDAKVTGYKGYNKKSFLELPTTTTNKVSEEASSSSSEEPVKIVIKEDIRKRPASKKSSSSEESR